VNLMTNDHTLTYVESHVATLFDTLYEHRWCKFILVAICKGLYWVCFFHNVNRTDEFLHWRICYLLRSKHSIMPHRITWNGFAQEFSIMVHLITCLGQW
jgi:hypothetical protein